MPSVTLHLVLADRVLDQWLDAPSEAPFDPLDPTCTNAFYQGAFGPDLGYFPGGHRRLSELSHLVRSGDLTRALLVRAESPTEKAYVWGWVTHVLADQQVHPLVGRAVGEFLYGDRTVFADGAGHQAAHVQIETGLDAFYSRLFPTVKRRKMAPVFDEQSIGLIADAYREVYGIAFDPRLVLASHVATARKSIQGLLTIGLLSTALITRPVSAAGSGARWMCHGAVAIVKLGLARHPLAKAFLTPTPPAEWLVEEVGKVVDSFPASFNHHYRTGLRDLANFNLDTGEDQDRAATQPGTLEVLDSLIPDGVRLPPAPEDSTGGGGAKLSPAA